MSPRSVVTCVTVSRFPRVSGDEPVLLVPAGRMVMFSPRERG